MPPVCRVCRHEARPEIDRLLAADGASLRDIAGRYGDLSKSSLARH